MNQLNHKQFTGSCEISIEDDCLHGRILYINDIITYEGNTIAELKEAFTLAVDEYIEHCKQTGVEPNKPFSGSFNVRISPELHKEVVKMANLRDKSLNDFVKLSLQAAISKPEPRFPIKHESMVVLVRSSHHHQPTVTGINYHGEFVKTVIGRNDLGNNYIDIIDTH